MDVARKHMNEKSRSCSHESCSFVGTYEELRGHARCQHPFSRPSEIDPNRQRDWRRLERQRDIGDVLSSIRSAMPNSSVFGDYVIENEGEGGNEHENDVDFTGDDGHWWTVFLLFQFFSPTSTMATSGTIASRLRGHQHRRQRRGGSARLRQFVESLHRVSTSDATNSVGSIGGNSVGEQGGEPSRRRQRSQRRYHGDQS